MQNEQALSNALTTMAELLALAFEGLARTGATDQMGNEALIRTRLKELGDELVAAGVVSPTPAFTAAFDRLRNNPHIARLS